MVLPTLLFGEYSYQMVLPTLFCETSPWGPKTWPNEKKDDAAKDTGSGWMTGQQAKDDRAGETRQPRFTAFDLGVGGESIYVDENSGGRAAPGLWFQAVADGGPR